MSQHPPAGDSTCCAHHSPICPGVNTSVGRDEVGAKLQTWFAAKTSKTPVCQLIEIPVVLMLPGWFSAAGRVSFSGHFLCCFPPDRQDNMEAQHRSLITQLQGIFISVHCLSSSEPSQAKGNRCLSLPDHTADVGFDSPPLSPASLHLSGEPGA